MKIKVGDKVKVIAGDDRGNEGSVMAILRNKNKVVVSGVNVVTKNMKPSAANENGGLVKVERPINVSNVKLVSSDKAKTTKTVKAVEKTEKKPVAKKTATKKTSKKESGEK
jgi:large subunit ribosomal protein L24